MFHITGNLFQAAGNLPIQFRSGIGLRPGSDQPGQLAPVGLFCVGNGNGFVENLRHVVLLFAGDSGGFGGRFGSLFRNFRLGGFRELIQLASNKPVIVGFPSTGQAADHGQERGTGGGSGEQFPGEIGQIESVAGSGYSVRHNQTSFLL